MRASLFALGASMLVTACGDRSAGSVTEAPAPVVSAASVASARRPTRRYYFARTGQRCEVYSVDGDVFSTPVKAPCPLDLQPGERLRIAGRTCMRESTEVDRAIPAVCPDPLTNAEKFDRQHAEAAASATAEDR